MSADPRPAPLRIAAATGTTIKLIETRLGSKKTMLPAPVDGTEDETRRALIFYTAASKIEAEASKVPYRTRLEMLAEIVGLPQLSETNVREAYRIYSERLFDPANWTVLSALNSSGTIVANAFIAGTNPKELKSIGSLTTNTTGPNQRPEDICFLHVRVDMSFASMNNCNVVCTITTFIALPQTSHDLLDGNGVQRATPMTTWLGPSNICTMSIADFETQVLSMTNQESAANLGAPMTGTTHAVLETTLKDEEDKNFILKKLYSYLKNVVFQGVCPSLNNNPFDVLKDITQTVTDDVGNKSVLSVHNYFARLSTAMGCLPDKLETDVCLHAANNLTKSLLDEVELTSRTHRAPRLLTQYVQILALMEFKSECTKAERRISSLQKIVATQAQDAIAVNNAQMGVHINASASASVAASTLTGVPTLLTTPALQSHAEKTMIINNIPPFDWEFGMCLGCGSLTHKLRGNEHKNYADNVILCPHAGKTNFELNIKRSLTTMREIKAARRTEKGGGNHYGPRSPNKDSRSPSKKTNNWENKTFTERQAIVNSVTRSDKNRREFRDIQEDLEHDDRDSRRSERSRRSSRDSGRSRSRDRTRDRSRERSHSRDRDAGRSDCPTSSRNMLNYTVLPVLNVRHDGRKPLLVKLDGLLPHFKIGLARSDDRACLLDGCLDSGAGANVGYIDFFAGFLACNPQCVDKIYTSQGTRFAPIKMSGIVTDDNAGVTTTDLPIAVRLRTDYRHHNGDRVFITFALGQEVSINCIISNTFMKDMDATIDYGADRLYLNLEGQASFPMTYKRPTRNKLEPADRTKRQYFKDNIPALSAIQSVLETYSPNSAWLPHVTHVVTHFMKTTLASQSVPAPLPPLGQRATTPNGGVLRTTAKSAHDQAQTAQPLGLPAVRFDPRLALGSNLSTSADLVNQVACTSGNDSSTSSDDYDLFGTDVEE